MARSIMNIAAGVLLATPAICFAAKPVKITPGQTGMSGDQEYRNYLVECSNGKKLPVTAWDAGKRWCIGAASQENCSKKQIKAAKTACKID